MDLTFLEEDTQIVPKTEIMVVDFINRKLIGFKEVNNFQALKDSQIEVLGWIKQAQAIHTGHIQAIKQAKEAKKSKQKQAVGKSS